MSNIKNLKQSILDSAKLSYKEGLVAGISGNISAFDAETGCVIITPTSVPYDTMKLSDISVITLDGKIIEGPYKPSSEWKMHTAIYAERKDVLSIFHTHSPYATAFAVIKRTIPPILTEIVGVLGGEIPVAGFALPGTIEMGTEALKVLNGVNACLLSNHGVLTIGQTVEEAHIRAVYVEDAAKIYHYALTTGDKIHLVAEESIQKIRTHLGL